MGFIYIISCSKTNEVYIGQTTQTLKQRWGQHKSNAKRYQQRLAEENNNFKSIKRTKLCIAMKEHGIESFSMSILQEESNLDNLNVLEDKFIEEYDSINNGYNTRTNFNNNTTETSPRISRNIINNNTSFEQFRKYEVLNELPKHCIYIKKPNANTDGVAINKHPLCLRKEFTVKKHKTMENAKIALLKYLTELEESGIPKAKFVKKDDLPKGIRKIKNSYFVDKTVKGQTYRKAFSGFTDEENKANAIAYVIELIG